MFFLSQQSYLAYISLALVFSMVKALDYMLLPEDPDIFSECDGPDGGSMEFLDMSGLEVDILDDDIVEMKGAVKFLWNLGSTDNMELIVNTYQEKGSEFVPTVFNTQRRDGCRALFEEEEPWYDSLTKNIDADDRVCPVHKKEVVWNIHPANFSMLFKNLEGSNKEGTYKCVVHMKPYDQTGKYYEDLSLCFQVLGFLKKL